MTKFQVHDLLLGVKAPFKPSDWDSLKTPPVGQIFSKLIKFE